ncbi:hypothetical protein, partial [Pseudoduganella dura]|uniref:hypothetical protein n=1 Tax=Pseudoduganella dura TaxID=321982 RepID=UPI001E2A2502
IGKNPAVTVSPIFTVQLLHQHFSCLRVFQHNRPIAEVRQIECTRAKFRQAKTIAMATDELITLSMLSLGK